LRTDQQKTILNEITFSGKALQTGVRSRVTCRPACENTGIVFIRRDIENSEEIRLKDGAHSPYRVRRNSVGYGRAQVQTVEHFLAALWALEIDNMYVNISAGELPAMDGSAKEFLEVLKKAGIKEQTSKRRIIKIKEKETVTAGDSSLSVYPADTFSVSYSIDYSVGSIKNETFNFSLNENDFEKKIAPARTFCMKEEAELLIKMGLGKGATLENTLVLDDKGPLGTDFRFSNEPVRHKVLDLIGDFYTLGVPIIGRVEAVKSGHKLNIQMMKKIAKKVGRNK